MKLYKILLFLTVLFSFSSTIGFSQTVETVRLEIEKGIPGESFSNSKFVVDFWIHAENFASIDTANTELLILRDDTGKDLIKEHEMAVAVYQKETDSLAKTGRYRVSSSTSNLIEPERWRGLRDTLGFRPMISSEMIRPADGATKVHAKMKITYHKKLSNKDSMQVNIPSLYENPSFIYKRKEVQLDDNQSMTHGDTKFIIFTIPKDEIDFSILSIKILDGQGNPIEHDSFGSTTQDQFMLKESEIGNPIKLMIYFVSTTIETITIDKSIGIGLD